MQHWIRRVAVASMLAAAMAGGIAAAQAPGGIPWVSGSQATTAEPPGKKVFTRGNVMSVERLSGWRLLNVVDQGGPYRVYVPDAVWGAIPGADSAYVPGARVELYVSVIDNQGTRQLVADQPTHLRISPTPLPTGVPGSGTAPAAAPAGFNWDSARPSDVNAALAADLGSEVKLTAKVVSVGPPRANSAQPWSIFVTDGSGPAGKVVVFQDTYNEIPNGADLLRTGNSLDMFVEVAEYRSQRQLTVREADHIRLTPGTNLAAEHGFGEQYIPVTAATLNMRLVGMKVSVSGAVTHYEPSPSPRVPHRITLTDGPSAVNVVYWPEVHKLLDPQISQTLEEFLTMPGDQRAAITANAQSGKLEGIPARYMLRVSGRVTEFRNSLQVNIEPEDQTNAPIGLYVP